MWSGSLDIISETASFSVSAYEVAVIIVSPTPVTVKAVAIAVVGGIIWPIGSVLAVNAAVQSKQNKQSEDSPRKKNNNYT